MTRSLLLIACFAAALPAQAALIDLDIIGSTTPAEAALTAPIEMVAVKATEKGHLLALVPLDIPVEVRAYATGDLILVFPWYANFSVMNRGELETELKAAVSNAVHLKALSTVRAEGEAELPTFSSEEAAAVERAIKAVLEKE